MKIRPVGAEISVRTDRQISRGQYSLFSILRNAPKNTKRELVSLNVFLPVHHELTIY